MSEPIRMPDAAVGRLVRAATGGDERAWEQLVEHFDPILRAIARGFRLGAADVDDTVQNTWLRAWCHLEQLRCPEAIGSWLIVTLRREAMRLLQRAVHEIPTDELPLDHASDDAPLDEAAIESERGRHVHDAVSRLPGSQRKLLSELLTNPPSYADVSVRLGMPVGSIGPTRERAIERLRRDRALVTMLHDAPMDA
jgi:RNA polymerase sigma factor (sigma-70 family)